MRGTVTQALFRSPSLAAQQMPYLPTLQQNDAVAHKRSPRRAQSINLVNDQAAPEIIILHAGWLDGEMLVWGEMPAAEGPGGDKRWGQRALSAAVAPLPYGLPNTSCRAWKWKGIPPGPGGSPSLPGGMSPTWDNSLGRGRGSAARWVTLRMSRWRRRARYCEALWRP